jgi:hypothetical protein
MRCRLPSSTLPELFQQLPKGSALCRCVGRVRPAGLRETYVIYEVVVPSELGGSGLTPQEAESYQEAYNAYCNGELRSALQQLRQVPLDDPVGAFQTNHTLAAATGAPPADWDGTLEFRTK